MTELRRQWEFFLLRLRYGIHLNKPSYLFKILRNIAKSKWYLITGQKKFVLRGIDFSITYGCNFHCSHCYAETLKPRGKQKTKTMTPEDYRRVADQAMELGCVVFSLQGGEPLMRRDLFDVIAAFYPKKNHVIMTTNGSLLNEELVKKLKSAGMDTLYFSIDSGIAEEHDKFRKSPGSFAKIMEAITHCDKHGMKVVINTTVSRDNLYTEGFKKILDWSKERRILLETIFARPLGNWQGESAVMLDKKDIEYYYQLRKNYPNVVRDLDNNYRKWGCPAGKEVLYITPYGDVGGCPYNHVKLGNVVKEPLGQVLKRAHSTKWYGEYNKECLTAENKEFMDLYFPLAQEKGMPELSDLIEANNNSRAIEKND